ncbi:MAG: hypothetical protein ACOCSN_06735, partial [Halanaeroarchaeum sp.]
MRIRDALESDADALAAVIDRPRGVMVDMIHDRSVRVAVPESEREGDATAETTEHAETAETAEHKETAEPSVNGFIAFDVHGKTVHVTDFGGGEAAVRRLFEEPQRFADRESMAVEVVVPDDEREDAIVERVGFESVGPVPKFDGRTTTRYRIESER